MSRAAAIARAEGYFDSGRFKADLARRVAALGDDPLQDVALGRGDLKRLQRRLPGVRVG